MHRTTSVLNTPSRRALVLQAGAAVLAACAPRAGPTATLTIGYQKNGVLLLAKSRGVVDTLMAPTRLKWVEFPSGPPLLEAMNAGAVDLGATGDTPPIFAQVAGSALQYVAYQPLTGEGEGLVVPANSPIHRLAELKGKRIAFTKASSSHLLVVNALASAGLTLAEAQPVFLSPSDAASAFSRSAVDAWGIWDPFFALAQRDQRARVLVSGDRLPRSDAFYLASNAVIGRAPEALSRLLDALRAEAAWGEAHRDELIRIVSRANGLPPDIVDISLRRGRLAVEPLDRAAVLRQQAAADTLQNIAVIPRKIRVAEAAWSGWIPKS
jgi:aliphatic sulfonates family ABC transporter substrate-binding protein